MYDGEPTTSPFTRAGCAGSPSLDSAMPKSMSTSRPSGPSSKVGRLHVTVDDAGVVHGADRGEELQADRGDDAWRQRAPAAEQIGHGPALVVVHHQAVRPAVLDHVMHGGHVGMTNLGRHVASATSCGRRSRNCLTATSRSSSLSCPATPRPWLRGRPAHATGTARQPGQRGLRGPGRRTAAPTPPSADGSTGAGSGTRAALRRLRRRVYSASRQPESGTPASASRRKAAGRDVLPWRSRQANPVPQGIWSDRLATRPLVRLPRGGAG
jgi:hypothetical protein